MLSSVVSRARRAGGYTLIEALVVISCSVVLVSALSTLVIVSLHQTTRTFTKVDATQRARTTIESILNELHSTCIALGSTPIQSGSSGTSLVFTSTYGNAATPTTVQHTLTFNASQGTLTDTTASGTTTLLTNVSQSASTPVFQYFAYAEPTNSSGSPYTDSQGDPYMMLLDGTTPVPGTNTIPTPQPLSVPLSANDAQNAVEVVMTLVVGPSGGTLENTNLAAGNETVADSVVLRLTPAPNHAGSGESFGPCE